LARLLAAQGIGVLAVDPDREMLRVARAPDLPTAAAGRVKWRLGASSDIDAEVADFVVMFGHVAQVFTDDEFWLNTSMNFTVH
jgi:2-polyprenyl-3-methyl-5-hydroxy-6-metoxy-1,4-benzoquinol methylase